MTKLYTVERRKAINKVAVSINKVTAQISNYAVRIGKEAEQIKKFTEGKDTQYNVS